MQVLREPCDEGVVLAGRSAVPCEPGGGAVGAGGDDPRLQHGVHRRHGRSTSRCRRCRATSAPRWPRCSGSSRPTRSSCPRCCWSAARWATASAGGASSCSGVAGFAAGLGRRAAWRRASGQLIAARAVQGIGARAAGAGEPGPHLGVLRRGAARAGHRHLVRLQRDHRRRSGRCSAAGWSTTPPGAGCSSSICRWPLAVVAHLAALRAGEPRRARRAAKLDCAGALARHAWAGRHRLRPHRVAAAAAGATRWCSAALLVGVARARGLPRGGVARRRPR